MLKFLKNSTGQILNLFFQDTEKEYHFREIGRLLKKEPGSLQSSINSLIKEGLLYDERKGNLRFFKLNKKYPLYEEVKKIVSKTLGIEAHLGKLVSGMNELEAAFIFGSIAKGEEYSDSDIDLMLVGGVDQDDLIEKISQLEKKLGREINYQIFSTAEVVNYLKDENDFWLRIFREPKIILKGSLDNFQQYVK